jgi:hypothetical protein
MSQRSNHSNKWGDVAQWIFVKIALKALVNFQARIVTDFNFLRFGS